MPQVKQTPLSGLKLLEPKIFGDPRGFFFESYRSSYLELGIEPMIQVNFSRSTRGVLRGLHYQIQQPQAKLITITRGEVFDVAVDLRRGSPTFGQHYSAILSDQNHLQMYIPIGYAHGFCVLSDEADFVYQCSDYYAPHGEVGILWNDPDLKIAWPLTDPILSEKDQRNSHLRDLESGKLLPYEI